MNASTPNAPSGLELFAVSAAGTTALAIETPGGNVHDVLERLPPGVYSALRTFHHDRFLWLEAHLERTERSMALLGWRNSLDRARLRRALHAAVGSYPLADARVRFDVLPVPFAIQGIEADTFVALSPFVPVAEDFLRDGVRVELARHLERKAPRIKTTDFVRARRPLPLSTKQRYEGVLLDAKERILECSSANIGFFRGRTVVAAGDGVLEGITMQVLRHIAPTLGYAWADERLPLADLESVDEAFLSSSSRGIVPIVQIEEVRVGDGRVGPRTRALLAAYLSCAEREARPAIDLHG